jgi:hypothetical protein
MAHSSAQRRSRKRGSRGHRRRRLHGPTCPRRRANLGVLVRMWEPCSDVPRVFQHRDISVMATETQEGTDDFLNAVAIWPQENTDGSINLR